MDLARAEPGAEVHAALVAVLHLGINSRNRVVKLSDPHENVVVHDPDTRRALLQLGRRRVRAMVEGLYAPWTY
jgi:hypothetical protein